MPPRSRKALKASEPNAEGEKGASEAKALRRTRGRAKGAEKAEVVGPREEEARTSSARQGRGKKGAEPATKPRRVQFRGQKENMRMEVDQQKQSRKRRKKAGSEEDTTTHNSDDGPAVPASKRPKKGKKEGTSSDSTTAVEDTDRAILHLPEATPISHPSHPKVPGRVVVFGQGDTGQLGLGEEVMERKKPSPVGGELEGKNVVQVVCGGMHTAALTEGGKVYTWGCNDEGALGRETEEGEEYIPQSVEKLENVTVVQISAGDSHTVALANNGDVYCWGVFRDSNGPFGLVKSCPSVYPELVYSSSLNKAIKVASGSDHVVILTDQGDVFTFGCGEQGQLGRVPEYFSTRGGRKGISLLLDPQNIHFRKQRGFSKPKFSDVFCGNYNTFALSQDGGVYVWGLNNYGQLGTSDVLIRYQPERLGKAWIEDETEGTDSGDQHMGLSGGQHHTVLCSNGSVYVLGRKEYGRLGLGRDCEEAWEPQKLPGLENVKKVAAGSSCSFAVTEKGEAFAWGMGTNHQLGTGEEDDSWTPVKITGKKIENCRVLDASAGGQHTALLVSNEESVD